MRSKLPCRNPGRDMLGPNTLSEILEQADGVPSATKLPLDATSSRLAFETATFGLG